MFGKMASSILCGRRIKYKLLNGYSMARVRMIVCCLCCIGLLLLLIVLAPIVFYFSTTLQDFLIFRDSVDFSPELASPELVDLHNTRSFYITTEDGVKLGTWHVLPAAAPAPSIPETLASRAARFEDELRKDGSVAVIYYHGNTPSRSQGHRVALCKMLAKLGCHVFAFDYRSFADSSTAPLTQEGLLADGMAVYDHVASRVRPGTAIILWGHSLGTGVASGVAAALCSRGAGTSSQCADGLVLHSGFTDLLHAILDNRLATAMRWLPHFRPLIEGALSSRGLLLDTAACVRGISGPILLLHAQDDTVLPVEHARELHAIATSRGGTPAAAAAAAGGGAAGAGGVTYVEFSGDLGYGHNSIVDAPELPTIIGEHIQLCREYHEELRRERGQRKRIRLQRKRQLKHGEATSATPVHGHR